MNKVTFEELINTYKTIVVLCDTYKEARWQQDNLIRKKGELIYKVYRANIMVMPYVTTKNGCSIRFVDKGVEYKLLGVRYDYGMYQKEFQTIVDGFDEDEWEHFVEIH